MARSNSIHAKLPRAAAAVRSLCALLEQGVALGVACIAAHTPPMTLVESGTEKTYARSGATATNATTKTPTNAPGTLLLSWSLSPGMHEVVGSFAKVAHENATAGHENVFAPEHWLLAGNALAEEKDDDAPVNSHVPRKGHQAQPVPGTWHALQLAPRELHAVTGLELLLVVKDSHTLTPVRVLMLFDVN